MSKTLRSPILWVGVALLAAVVVVQVATGGDDVEEMGYRELLVRVRAGGVAEAVIRDRSNTVVATLDDGRRAEAAFAEGSTDELVPLLDRHGVAFRVDRERQSPWVSLLVQLLPFAVIVGLFVLFFSSLQGGGRGVLRFGRARPRQPTKDHPRVTFADVAGADEAVEELQEIKELLESPAKFQAIGASIPKGVLLVGPPGTGKTLLARAVAGEAGVPFFSISGSDFVEMFVGVGASRVRDLFERAKKSAPAIVFVDEIDAVGRHRGAGLGGGHDEREQTLNQLLVEMDGFDPRQGVILIAATNRPDILDPALLRPGRFDRQVVVDRPDLDGRRAILNVHAKGKPLAPDVDLAVLARRTPGFTGADLANLVNEAALLAARRGIATIGRSELDDAIDRVLGGPERKTRVMSEREKRVVAYHEAGHALVGHLLPNTDPIHKVSIVARGRALGWTVALPDEDRYLRTRSELRDQLAMLLAGRTAEELAFGDPTTGAADDIEKATAIARAMVTELGMTDALGPQKLGSATPEPFLGRSASAAANCSDAVATRVDLEVRRLLDEAHDEATEILRQHRAVLDRLADALVERETLDTVELAALLGHLPTWRGRDDAGRAAGDGNGRTHPGRPQGRAREPR